MIQTLAIVLLLAAFTGCATAAPVVLDMTLPAWNSLPDSPCSESVGDTLKDLSTAYVYAQASGLSDSTLVLTQNVAGMAGQPLTVTVQRPEGSWLFWTAVADATGNRSCRSNVVAKTVALVPAPAVMK